MNQSILPLAGRALISAIFIVAGIRKAVFYAGTVGYFTKLGFPMPEVMVWLAIVIEVVGGIFLLIGFKTRATAWLLFLLTAIATFMAHRFWEFEPAQFQNQLNHFLKNLAVMGGLVYCAAYGPGRSSVDKS